MPAVALLVVAAACSSGGSPSGSGKRPTPQSTKQSALARWTAAYAFLSAQSKPTEIVCSWFKSAGGQPAPVARSAEFYDFTARSAWKTHVVTRADAVPTGTFEDCEATVPTSVPYDGQAIQGFLSPLGLAFVADPNRPAGLTPIEIAYAGQDASDPDIVFRDEPGLFGLRIALAQLGDAPFQPGTSKIVQPTTEATAAQYLEYAAPLLTWYGYKG